MRTTRHSGLYNNLYRIITLLRRHNYTPEGSYTLTMQRPVDTHSDQKDFTSPPSFDLSNSARERIMSLKNGPTRI